MPNPRAALPPGVYKIILHSYSSIPGEPKAPKPGPEETVIACPPNKGGALYLTDYKDNAPEQLWQIEGDGTMTSMSDPGAKCYSDTPSFARNPVVRWTGDKPCKCIIYTRRIPDNTFEGYIMTNDTKMNYWGCSHGGDEIKLQESGYLWKFESVLS